MISAVTASMCHLLILRQVDVQTLLEVPPPHSLSLSLYIYIYIYIYVYVYIYVYIYIYMYRYMYRCNNIGGGRYAMVAAEAPGRGLPHTDTCITPRPYRGTSLIRNRAPLGP